MKLYTTTAAARELGLGLTSICAMKKAGLKFSHGRLTTLKAVMDWMAAHPNFRQVDAYPVKAASKPPIHAATPNGQHAGKYGELS